MKKLLTSKSKVMVIDTDGSSTAHHEGASNVLNGVRKAAMAAGRRLAALEEQAEASHAKTLLSCTARILSTPESGLHALLTDAHGVTIEISGGAVAAAVASSARE